MKREMRFAGILEYLAVQQRVTKLKGPILCLVGPPGVGKSQMVAQVAEKNDIPVIDIRLSQMEPSDLRGIPFKNGESVEWAVPSMLPNAERHGPKGILFLDEIESIPLRAQIQLLRVLEDEAGENAALATETLLELVDRLHGELSGPRDRRDRRSR